MKLIIIIFALFACTLSALGQAAARDTIFIYETIIVRDTVFISDTVRIRRAPVMPAIKPIEIDVKYFSAPTATFSKNCIIFHERSFENSENFENSESKNRKLKIQIQKLKDMKLNVTGFFSGVIIAAQTTVSGLFAQPVEEEPLPTMPVQFSIFYPMTTMGARTTDYRFNLSVNMFAGRVGAVRGIEYGWIYNHVERDMTGAQFAGIANRTREMNGAQFGGIANFGMTVRGAQFGGIANISESFQGVQFGGIANVSRNTTGIQFGGIANVAESVKGIQFGGIANYSKEEFSGIQFGSIGNVTEDFSGIGFGGIFNRTGTLRGVQFGGIVNVVDTIESGVSIALINVVRKGGYRAWSVTSADYLNVAVSFKMGIPKFYTSLTLGANVFMGDKLWASGVGFGTRRTMNQRFDFQPEVISYQYYARGFPWFNRSTGDSNSTHLKFGFVYKLNDRLGIVVAPSIYHFNYDADKIENMKISPIPSLIEFERNWRTARYSSSDEIRHRTKHSFGVGISIGVVFN